MKKIIMIIMAAVLVALPTTAQTFGQQEPQNAAFQSTSTMQGSGSAYSSNPTLNENGTAYSPAAAPAGRAIRTSLPDPPEKTGQGNTPIGDAMVPLLIMSFVFCGVIALRRKRNAISK